MLFCHRVLNKCLFNCGDILNRNIPQSVFYVRKSIIVKTAVKLNLCFVYPDLPGVKMMSSFVNCVIRSELDKYHIMTVSMLDR
jgi:hypothetical protein